MRKSIVLVSMLVVLSVAALSPAPAAAQADVPLCGIIHTDKDGNIICDDPPGTTGIIHTDGAALEPVSDAEAAGAVLDVLLALIGIA